MKFCGARARKIESIRVASRISTVATYKIMMEGHITNEAGMCLLWNISFFVTFAGTLGKESPLFKIRSKNPPFFAKKLFSSNHLLNFVFSFGISLIKV